MENINLIWQVDNMTVWPQIGTFTNVTYMVNFKVTAQNPPQWGNVIKHDAVMLPPPDESTFVPYDQLTEFQVINWVKSVLGPIEVAKIENELWHRSMIIRSVVHANELVVGQTYRIEMVGDTDWTLVGASANQLGVIFTATGPGTGSGMAGGSIPLTQPGLPWN